MRAINIANDKGRNAQVGFEPKRNKSDIAMVCQDGSRFENVRVLKSTLDTDPQLLVDKYETIEQLACDIINGNPEVDSEKVGMLLSGVRRIYISESGHIVHRMLREEVRYGAGGEQMEVRPYEDTDSNINSDLPLRWTGKLIPKEKAVRMFVFSRKYQVKHINGLTYDFLYDMAKTLAEKRCLMMVGAGAKGVDPVVLTSKGTPYRAFLEGRTTDDGKYCLILHLTNLELKTL
jgi:hypothetical protein